MVFTSMAVLAAEDVNARRMLMAGGSALTTQSYDWPW
jgi:hypothetical protein